MSFGGDTYDRERDGARLFVQLAKVRALMLDGQWRTLAQISSAVSAPQASVSARLRDLRKEKFGNYVVNRRRVLGGHGLHEYQVEPPVPVVVLD